MAFINPGKPTDDRPEEKSQTDDNMNVSDGSMEQNEVRTAKDPTKAVLSKSGLSSKFLCDYVVNVATGCRHGCKFCYVPSTPNIRTRPEMLDKEVNVDDGQREWGSYVLYRDGLGERLDQLLDRKRTWKRSEEGCGIVGISFSTDCYMDGRAGKITRNVVDTLVSHKKYARILTRNPILALQDIDVYTKAEDYVTIGSSIPSLNRDEVLAIEPRAPSPDHRLRGLEEFNDYNVNTYVSMSPTYPTQDKSDLRSLMERIAKSEPDVIFHEPINPRGANFDMTINASMKAGEKDLTSNLVDIRDRNYWIRYAVTHLKWVQQLGEELDLPVHLWPDKQLVTSTEGAVSEWLQHWRERQSPEHFGARDVNNQEAMQPPTNKEIDASSSEMS